MQISKIITTVVATACVSTAVPTAQGEHAKEPMVGPGGNVVCGNGQVISCCNQEKEVKGGLGLLDGLLGGNCSPLTIPVVGVPIAINKACGNNQAACCTGDQVGLVNLQCTNINVI